MIKSKLEKILVVGILIGLGWFFSIQCLVRGQRPTEKAPEVFHEQTGEERVASGDCKPPCGRFCDVRS